MQLFPDRRLTPFVLSTSVYLVTFKRSDMQQVTVSTYNGAPTTTVPVTKLSQCGHKTVGYRIGAYET